jgi:hypothetical protein
VPTFEQFWSQLQQSGAALPYVMIDCAGVEGGAERLPRAAFSEFECLFTGDLADELEDVAPYLGQALSWGEEVQAVIEDLMKRQVATLVTLRPPPDGAEPPSFAQVHRHLRKFNVVYAPDGKPLFWRYYDPRIIVDVLKVLDDRQLEAFFGPMEQLCVAAGVESVALCSRSAERLLVQV